MQCSFDDILGEKDGPMSILPSLMFSKTQSTLKIDDLIGKRLKLEDFDKSLVDLLRKHTGPVGDEKGSFYIFGRRVDKGYMRYYFTPDFERDFKTDEEEPDFCSRQPCWRPIFSTPSSHDKIMKAIAESYKKTTKLDTPPPKLLSVQATRRALEMLSMCRLRFQVRGVRARSARTYFFFTYS